MKMETNGVVLMRRERKREKVVYFNKICIRVVVQCCIRGLQNTEHSKGRVKKEEKRGRAGGRERGEGEFCLFGDAIVPDEKSGRIYGDEGWMRG